jgi:DNA-binding ferritin-like protein
MGEITKEEVRERLGNIDQIRDIIFGAQSRDYDNRLDKMESDVALLQQDVRERLDQLKTSLSSDLKASIEALEKKLKAFHFSAQEECADLRQHSDRMSKKFASSIQALDEALDSQTASLRGELVESRRMLEDDVNTLRDLMLEELERRFANLREGKVSKDDFAEALFALGMRIKGRDFIPTLREASSNHEVDEFIPLIKTRKLSNEDIAQAM